MDKKKKENQKIEVKDLRKEARNEMERLEDAILLPPKLVALLAEEVAKTVVRRLPQFPKATSGKKKKKTKKIEDPILLDTSAIIDGRIFDVINLGLVHGYFIVLESILAELKHIADSQDTVKRERGRKGLAFLEKLRKARGVKVLHISAEQEESMGVSSSYEVDERLIKAAKGFKGRIITCDFNLEKKASVAGVQAINVNTLANVLKVIAVPGESLHIKVLHRGKDITQGVAYLDDGTMIVIENASSEVGREIDVMVSRVIQTTAGRILFSKKI